MSDKSNAHQSLAKRAIKTGIILLSAGVLSVSGYYFYRQHLTANFHVVTEGLVYRSAQPTPSQLAAWQEKYRIRTVINLRGEQEDQQSAEVLATARQLGVEVRSLSLSADEQPPTATLQELLRMVETAQPPVHLHCLAGIDRTGLASVIAQMAVGKQPYSAAIDQLSVKYFHVDNNPDRLAGVFARYEDWCQTSGKPTAGYEQFREWTMNTYHPYYYKACISGPAELTLSPGSQTMADIVVENCSSLTLPAADPRKTFTLAVFTGSSVEQMPDAELGPRIQLPKQDLVPGQKITIRQPLIAPATPGTYLVHHDLIEENRTWFAKQGSPVPTLRLTVR